jgi:hypothetical protein
MLSLPFSFVETDLVVRYDRTCTNTLIKYMDLVCRKLQDKMRMELTSGFDIILDRRTEGSDHYIALFACYGEEKMRKYPLLAFEPIPDYGESVDNEYQLGAEAHKQLIEQTLEHYDRSLTSAFLLVGDNCSTRASVVCLWLSVQATA